MKKRLLLLISGIVFCLIVLFSLKTPKESKLQEKTLQNKEDSIAIMVKEEGATDYTKYSSKDIPKGSYSLNTEKTYCKNNGTVTDYNSSTGTISFNFIGTDKCFLYFDYIAVAAPSLAYERILLANGEWATDIASAKSNIEGKNEPDFTSDNEILTNEGLYVTSDDRGTSYYFRGAVDNNWVKFATDTNQNDMYWRIVRINGDNTIRLIYSGNVAPTVNTAVSMSDREPAFSSTFVGNSLAYGFQYGNSPAFAPCDPGSSSCNNDEGNTVYNSQIKVELENWYEANLLDNYDVYIASQIYCADFYYNGKTLQSDPYLAGYHRYNDRVPSLKCVDDGNYTYKFCSMNDENEDCNMALPFSIGLLTMDEALMAGANNENFYLSGTDEYLGTGSAYVASNGPFMFALSNGVISYDNSDGGRMGVFPVISLNSDVMFSGSGTWDDPYVVTN